LDLDVDPPPPVTGLRARPSPPTTKPPVTGLSTAELLADSTDSEPSSNVDES